jgi:hypothetical protein
VVNDCKRPTDTRSLQFSQSSDRRAGAPVPGDVVCVGADSAGRVQPCADHLEQNQPVNRVIDPLSGPDLHTTGATGVQKVSDCFCGSLCSPCGFCFCLPKIYSFRPRHADSSSQGNYFLTGLVQTAGVGGAHPRQPKTRVSEAPVTCPWRPGLFFVLAGGSETGRWVWVLWGCQT